MRKHTIVLTLCFLARFAAAQSVTATFEGPARSILITNPSSQPVLSYTIRAVSPSGHISDHAIVNLVSGAPVLEPNEQKTISLSGVNEEDSVTLDSVMLADGTTAGPDEAETISIIRRRLVSHPNPGLPFKPPNPWYGPNFGYVQSFECQPATCSQQQQGTGTFGVSMAVQGYLTNYQGLNPQGAGISAAVSAKGCRIPITLFAYGAEIQDTTYGFGFAAIADASQAGTTILQLGYYHWYNRDLKLGNPINPCA